MLLERIEPSFGRGERLRLDVANSIVSLGRAEESDIRLYTTSASRDHASIVCREDGEWVLTPMSGRSVLIDGERTVTPIALEPGMNIVLGQDHLRCVTGERDRGVMGSSENAPATEDAGRRILLHSASSWRIIALVVPVVLVGICLALFFSLVE